MQQFTAGDLKRLLRSRHDYNLTEEDKINFLKKIFGLLATLLPDQPIQPIDLAEVIGQLKDSQVLPPEAAEIIFDMQKILTPPNERTIIVSV